MASETFLERYIEAVNGNVATLEKTAEAATRTAEAAVKNADAALKNAHAAIKNAETITRAARKFKINAEIEEIGQVQVPAAEAARTPMTAAEAARTPRTPMTAAEAARTPRTPFADAARIPFVTGAAASAAANATPRISKPGKAAGDDKECRYGVPRPLYVGENYCAGQYVIVPVDTDVQPSTLVAAKYGLSGQELALEIDAKAEAFSHPTAKFLRTFPSDSREENALLSALRIAYSSHYGVVLSPDVVFNTVLQGLSIHVNRDPERYRALLVNHAEGKIELIVDDHKLLKGCWENDWGQTINGFTELIVNSSPTALARLAATTRFSTTTKADAVANVIALMSVSKTFYDFTVRTKCGIPFVKLLGSRGDWEALKIAVNGILDTPGLGMDAWRAELQPILDTFVEAFDGARCADARQTHWRRIFTYKEPRMSGGRAMISGWIGKLFPYVHAGDEWVENPMLSSSSGRVAELSPSNFPRGLAETGFKWAYHNSTFDMRLVAGAVGVIPHESISALQPVIGWLVAQK